MGEVNERECEKAGLDLKKVASIVRRLSKAASEADRMGLHIFGGSGAGVLRFYDGSSRPLIVAHLDGTFDGGDGACNESLDGFLRGE